MAQQNLIVIQARMQSLRLPQKMTMSLGKYNLIEWVIKRVKKSKNTDGIVLATSNKIADDVLIKIAKENNILTFRGSEKNVFDRYLQIGKMHRCKTMVRVSGDNPFTDPKLIDNLIYKFNKKKSDYGNNLYNFDNSKFIDGFGAEIFTFEVLNRIKNKLNKYHREHVTSYITENKNKFNILKLKAPKYLNKPNLKFDINTKNDLNKIRKLIIKSNIKINFKSQTIVNRYLNL